jgi:transcriptional regulator with XRE-family HTH domain
MPKSMFSDAYGRMLQVLIAARGERGLTQKDLAFALGKHQSFIAKIEGGERRLDVIEFCAIARALNRDPAVLFGAVLRALPKELSI